VKRSVRGSIASGARPRRREPGDSGPHGTLIERIRAGEFGLGLTAAAPPLISINVPFAGEV
jgi:hypothetical protein